MEVLRSCKLTAGYPKRWFEKGDSFKIWPCSGAYPKSTDLSMLPGAVECLQLLLDARAELDLKDLTAQGVSQGHG